LTYSIARSEKTTSFLVDKGVPRAGARESIDSSKIGEIFAVGGENVIRWYDGKNLLLKTPIGIRIRLGKQNFVREAQNDFPILKNYLGKYLPREVSIVVSKDKKKFSIVQTFVDGSVLKKSDLKIRTIKKQFIDVVNQNKLMEKEKNISWDFFGAWSLFLGNKNRIGNLLVTPDRKVKIIDIGTVRIGRKGQPFIIWLIIKWAIGRQRRYIASLCDF